MGDRLSRTQLTQGRKVLSTLDMLSKLVQREPSISVIISSVSNMLPQKYLLEKRAIVDAEGGTLLNEDNDLRSGENCEITTKESITLSDEKKASPLITSDCKLAHEVSEKDITKDNEHSPSGLLELADISLRNNFLMRFNVEQRSVVSHLFHQWAKKPAFQQPKRLLDKVSFVIDERLRNKAYKHKDVMRLLKPSLTDDEAFLYAQYVLRWEQIPSDKRAHLTREKQEHFQKLRIENSMGSSEATAKQISYLQSLGCTVKPDSRLHASRLIEQYKSL